VNSLILTEKQQEVLWLRYGRRASIDQIAGWLHITRRAVLARLRNARQRAGSSVFSASDVRPVMEDRLRTYPASQISTVSGGPMCLDEF
jgi:DNA-binding transcriptional regulator LsrR (DeoR family)